MSKNRYPWLDSGEYTRSRGSERRTSTRYAAVDSRCRVGWWEGPQFRELSAVLRNISTRGALITSEELPPAGVRAWLFLEGNAQTPWLQAGIVKASRTEQGCYQVALVFVSPCPYETFKAAAFGPMGLKPNAQNAAEGVSEDHGSRDWW